MERGREPPPVMRPVLSRGRPGGLLTPLCRYRKPPSKPRVICAPITDAFSVAYLSQIAHGMYRDLEDGFRLRTHLGRPSHDQSRAVLDVVKVSLRSTLRASALTTPVRSSKVALKRWPTKLDFISALTGCASGRFVKISSMHRASLRSLARRGALKPTLSEQRCQLLSTTSRSIAHAHAISAFDFSHALRCRRHATSTLVVMGAPAPRRRALGALHRITNVGSEFRCAYGVRRACGSEAGADFDHALSGTARRRRGIHD